MKLTRVEVVGYRGIDRLALELDELTTIIGEHDCGKSSLLRAIALVLDPTAVGPPTFTETDFHRRFAEDSERASQLSITLELVADAREPDGHSNGPLGQALRRGPMRLRIRATRRADGTAETAVDVLGRRDRPLTSIDADAALGELQRRSPAIIVGRPRAARPKPEQRPRGRPGDRLREVLAGAARAGGPATWEDIHAVRGEVVEAVGVIADQLTPTPARERTVRDLTDTPRPLSTDLAAALAPDAGRQRRVAALWLLMAIDDAMPPDGLPESADPILLFDDIEANLHPTWLAALCSVAINLPFQSVVATHSSEVLAWVPLSSLRRLSRAADHVEARQVVPGGYSDDELRRLTYHLRLNRGGAFFARCWVLVEGQTEAWLVPEFARLVGVEFPIEGIRTIEFAQAGVSPLLRLADDLGIRWVVLTDGDEAGAGYTRTVQQHLDRSGGGFVVELPARDIEHYLFEHGYRDVIAKAAGQSPKRRAGTLIAAAVKRVSKPGLALRILAAADRRGAAGVPAVMRALAETAYELARA